MLIKNARVVTPDDEFIGVVEIENGLIRTVEQGATQAPGALDWDGDYLVPGLVEIHTDNLEKHLAPRPGVLWNIDAAFVIHDAQVAAAGITTVFDALAIGERGNVGIRSRDNQFDSADVLERHTRQGLLRADHYLHLRCEVATVDVVDTFEELRHHPLLRLVSVMDHTPGQRQWTDHAKYRQYQERNGKWSDEQWRTTLAGLHDEQARFADLHRAAIVERCRALGLPVASHDDTLVEHVEQAVSDGMAISEFPTTMVAAQAARAHRMINVMGAPNVVRGGSHSGNVSALELAHEGLLDVLSSDYVPSSLMHAAFELTRRCGWPLSRAMATVTANPARVVGLADRGAIVPGLRADLVRVHKSHDLPVPRATYREGARIA
jgi:alpha-D-ribose 1-methylphosphonate 5-triphosphate diphosphatase